MATSKNMFCHSERSEESHILSEKVSFLRRNAPRNNIFKGGLI
jgi:hypothetical protein